MTHFLKNQEQASSLSLRHSKKGQLLTLWRAIQISSAGLKEQAIPATHNLESRVKTTIVKRMEKQHAKVAHTPSVQP